MTSVVTSAVSMCKSSTFMEKIEGGDLYMLEVGRNQNNFNRINKGGERFMVVDVPSRKTFLTIYCCRAQ